MPIIRHTIDTQQQANGSTYNILKMYDQEEQEYQVTFAAGVGVDVAPIVTKKIDDLDVHLAIQEVEQILEL
jgi:hypothetical protein